MPTLHLHLREGFVGERVVVHVDDDVALDAPNVRTRTQIGLAATQAIPVPGNRPVALRVELPGRGRSHTVRVDPRRTPYVGVSVDATGEMDVICTRDAFGYV